MYGCNQWIKNKAWKSIASPSPVQVCNSWASFGEKKKMDEEDILYASYASSSF